MKELPGEPKYLDLVKNERTNAVGTVIGKYPISKVMPLLPGMEDFNVIDVRLESGGEEDRDIWYNSPAKYWKVIKAHKDE
jgi:hypothetical protein